MKTVQTDIQKALEISELRYRRLFETAQDGVLLIDFKTGMILDANPFLTDMLGYSKKDFLKKYLWEVGVFKDVAASKENFRTLQTKRYARFEDLPLQTKSGKRKDVEFVANAYQVGDTSIIQCNIRDITDRKIIENKIKESEGRYKSLYESSSDAIMTIEPPAWKFTAGNPATVKMFNTENEKEFTTLGPWDVSPQKQPDGQDSSKKAQQMIMKAMEDGSNSFEWVHKRYKGEDFPATVLLTRFKLNGKDVVQATVRDLSEEKAAEVKYEQLFNNAVDAIFIADPATKQLVACNSAAEKLTGYSKDKILSMKADELHPKDKVEETMAGFKKQVEGKINIFSTEVLTKDNKRIPVSINAAAIRMGDKDYVEGIFRDITEEKERTEDLEKMNKLMVGRELKMIELKDEIAKLENKI
jgi:PAS domain S-box-containing protein